jgi:hypothetical protein
MREIGIDEDTRSDRDASPAQMLCGQWEQGAGGAVGDDGHRTARRHPDHELRLEKGMGALRCECRREIRNDRLPPRRRSSSATRLHVAAPTSGLWTRSHVAIDAIVLRATSVQVRVRK